VLGVRGVFQVTLRSLGVSQITLVPGKLQRLSSQVNAAAARVD
jgi:hypothetical protein